MKKLKTMFSVKRARLSLVILAHAIIFHVTASAQDTGGSKPTAKIAAKILAANSTQRTARSTQRTVPSTQRTVPSSQRTADSTQSASDSIQSASDSIQSASDSIRSASDSTKRASDSTKKASDSTKPAAVSAIAAAASAIDAAAPAPPNKPFPQHTNYKGAALLPSHRSREALDDTVRSFYLRWKDHYILTGCKEGEKYVWFEGTQGKNICVSEGQGYGMMIVALMAGFDSTAQSTYDCLYRYYKSHPSTSSPSLMAWMQTRYCRSIDGGTATDGDMDIAYSLLLADAQWGRHSNIPYRQKAVEIIAAIQREEINPVTYIVMEANGETPRSRDWFDMRASDFMPDHIRAFRQATGDAIWDSVLSNNYRTFRYLQDTYSPGAGLVPDFIRHIRVRAGQGFAGAGPAIASASVAAPTPHGDGNDTNEGFQEDDMSAIPAQPNYLESKYDGAYNFNACRVPWRIATDYLVSGDKRAADFLARVNPWIHETTRGNPDNISAGYSLAGEDLPHRYYEALCFICPFAVAAMANPDSPENQQWLNKLWDYIVKFKMKDFDYYDNTIKMIDLIILSGNYWAPGSTSSPSQTALTIR